MEIIRFSFFGLMFVLLLSATVVSADARDQFQQAVSLSKQGDWKQAVKLFQQVASEQPDWPEPKNNLAVALLKLGQVEQARQTLEQAVISQASFKVAQANRQRLYDHLAANAYEKALGNSGSLQLPNLQLLDSIQQATVQPVQQSVVTDPVADITSLIHQQLNQWSSAWSESNVDAYLACYSPRFKPFERDMDYQQWRYQRRLRLKSSQDVKISLDDIKVFVDPKGDSALVEFVQLYRSANYTDKVIKQLLLNHDNKQWLIISERVIKAL
ncbi:MAG: tetratricopeptide repeat protein [Gammaproteobacteria bacterium]|nr:tetratricopeptide repeat protein [Gammaproteobacteria bacterium]